MEIDGAQGQESIRVGLKHSLRDIIYLENMGLLVGAGLTVSEAATIIADHGMSRAIKDLAQYRIPEPRSLVDLFQKYGGKKWAIEAGFCGDDPAVKVRRDDLLKTIPNKLLPDRFR